MPFSGSSLRMASARAKLRCFLACVRSATSASMSASVKLERRLQAGASASSAAFGFGPGQRGARQLGVAVFEHGEDAVELRQQREASASTFGLAKLA